jgi:hypothetical protein
MSVDWNAYYAKHKETYTKYREEHRDERRAQGREYYQLNKEKEKEKKKTNGTKLTETSYTRLCFANVAVITYSETSYHTRKQPNTKNISQTSTIPQQEKHLKYDLILF